jgi:hypothetical protein
VVYAIVLMIAEQANANIHLIIPSSRKGMQERGAASPARGERATRTRGCPVVQETIQAREWTNSQSYSGDGASGNLTPLSSCHSRDRRRREG